MVVFTFIPQKQFLTLTNPVEACCHIIGKHFEAVVCLSTNQLTLPCRVLHNIIAHVTVPRKGHLDEVNHYDVFILDSILYGRKIDFSYIMLQHISCVLSGTRPKTLSHRMIFTKNFQHFDISFRDSVTILPKAMDTINVLTLKRMKFFNKNGQWVAKSKWFDDKWGPSTLPFEGKDIHDDEDAPLSSPPRLGSHRPSSSTSDFTFTEDHYNLLNGRIDSLASTVDGLQHALSDLQNTATCCRPSTVDANE
ncbi:Protein kinase domain-containing protein [Abeliophyllum distichum]|uniref:Protein kinase domain-containing protein n=1 Tax=Abeliophyllum distichum TaxID=126358 RepID=A0ABD1VYQ4_9LAMI